MSRELTEDRPPSGLWRRALWLSDRTPEGRNRYVDFLRALSILAVVLGHWLISAPYFDNGSPAYSHVLDLAPWTRWLTWIVQVMPIFFFVGGFSNKISWESAQRKGLGYRAWFDGRMRRLVGPVLPLLVAWAAMVAVAHSNGVGAGMIRIIFLWHSTVMMLLVGLAFWQMPAVLGQQPVTVGWWWTRPLWIVAYAVASLPFLLVFARFERPATGSSDWPAAVWLQLVGCAVACLGLAMLALDGVGGSGWFGLRWIPLTLPLIGAGLAGFGPLGRLARSLIGTHQKL